MLTPFESRWVVLLVCLTVSCQAGLTKHTDGRHTTVYARDLDTSAEVARYADHAWEQVPDCYTNPSCRGLQVHVVPGTGSFTRLHRFALWDGAVTIQVGELDWLRSLWHEVFHGRSFGALEAVPPIIQEGLAEYHSAPAGPLRRGILARAYYVASGSSIPDAVFRFGSDTSIRRLYQKFEPPIGPRSVEDYPLGNTVDLDSTQLLGLDNAALEKSYSHSLVAVERLLEAVPEGECVDFNRLEGELAECYIARLNLGNQLRIREFASTRIEGISEPDLFWVLILPTIHRAVKNYQNPTMFFEHTEASLEIGSAPPLNLETDKGYVELVEFLFDLRGVLESK